MSWCQHSLHSTAGHRQVPSDCTDLRSVNLEWNPSRQRLVKIGCTSNASTGKGGRDGFFLNFAIGTPLSPSFFVRVFPFTSGKKERTKKERRRKEHVQLEIEKENPEQRHDTCIKLRYPFPLSLSSACVSPSESPQSHSLFHFLSLLYA